MNTENLLFIAIAATVFLVFMGLYKVTYEKQVKAQEKIKELSGSSSGVNPVDLRRQQQDMILKKRVKNTSSFLSQLEMKLERANTPISTTEFILISVGSALLTFLLCAFLFGQGLVLAVLEGAGGFGLPYLVLNIKVFLRLKKADAQFADVLDALVNCFKTGYGFSRAIQVIAENFEDPWATEFNKMAIEMNLGSNQEDALLNLCNRIPSADVDLFVTALLIQKETGGNMAELLGNLSNTCRERYKLYRKVSAISAQGKLSAGIVTCIPFGLIGMMYVFLPEPVTEFMTNPIGIILMSIVGVWMIMGIGVLFKIVQVEV